MIGPSFKLELTTAGITDWRFSWSADGSIVFHPQVPQSERDKVTAVLAAHAPSTPDPEQPERDAQAALAADARTDAIFEALQTATPAQIAAFVTTRFGTFTAPQQAVIRLLLQVVALLLRRGVV